MILRRVLPRAGIGATLAAGAGWLLLNRDRIQLESLPEHLTGLGHWAPAAFIVFYGLATLLFLPGSLFGLAGGALFGPVWGSVWNLAGATFGATLTFIVSRYITAGWVARHAHGRLAHIIGGVESEGWRFVILARLIPLFPFNLLNYALGLTRIRSSHYVIATAAGMLPGTVAYTWLGHVGREVAGGSDTALRSGLLALGALALLILLPRSIRRMRGPDRRVPPSVLAQVPMRETTP